MNGLKLALLVVFHPIRGFAVLKEDRRQFNYLTPVAMLLLILAVRIVSIYGMHYPLASTDPRETNLTNEIIRVIFPLLTWTVASYAITTIMEGKTLLREQFLATSYAMLPYIILTIPCVILSQFMGVQDMSIYNKLMFFEIAWLIMLFFISMKVMNEYSIGKTIGVCILSIISCFLIWMLLGLFFILLEQFITFIKEIAIEIKIFCIN